MNYFISYYNHDNSQIGNIEVPLNGKITSINTVRDIENYIQKMNKINQVSLICYEIFDKFEENKDVV